MSTSCHGTHSTVAAAFGRILLPGASPSRLREITPIGAQRYPIKKTNHLSGGAKGSRTPDLLNAIQALSQLSYGPIPTAAMGFAAQVVTNLLPFGWLDQNRRSYGSSSSSRSPMMSVTSSSVSSCSSIKAASSRRLVDLDIVFAAFDRFRVRPLLAGGFGVRLLERNEFGLLRLRHRYLFRRDGRDGPRHHRFRTCARRDRRELHHRVALRADDRVLVEVVEFRAAIAAKALGAKLGFCHGPGSSGQVLKLRCLTWTVELPLSIAGCTPSGPLRDPPGAP